MKTEENEYDVTVGLPAWKNDFLTVQAFYNPLSPVTS